MRLRLTKKEEIEALTKISVDAFHSDCLVGLDPNGGPPDFDSVQWHEKMRSGNRLYSYLDDGGTLIGGAVLFPSNESVYIGRIFISPERHRKGFGIKLMNDIEDAFPSAKLFKLDTPQNNVRTNAFYRKLGYVQAGIEDGFVTYTKTVGGK